MIPERYIMVLLCTVCVFINYADRVNISVAIIPMAKDNDFSIESQGIILSAFFVGYIPMHIGGAVLCRRFGVKAVLAYTGFFWSLFTALTPLACKAGFYILLLCRVGMGLAEGVVFPSVYHFFSTWVPDNERSRSVSVMLSGAYTGITFALIFSPIIIREYSWQLVFYSFGGLGLLWIVVWVFVAYDKDDEKDRRGASSTYAYGYGASVGDESGSAAEQELLLPGSAKISSTRPVGLSNSASFDEESALLVIPTPHSAALATIFTNKACLAVCISQAFTNMIHFTILTWLPSYFAHVYGMRTASLSFTFIPYFSMAVSANIGGLAADALLQRGFSLVQVRKLISTVVQVGAAVMLILFTMAPTVGWALFFISASLSFLSCNGAGFESSFLDLASPSLVGIFKAVANTMGSFAALVAIPFSTLVLRWAGGSWRIMFASLSIWFAIIAGVFYRWGSAERVLVEGSTPLVVHTK